MVCKAAIEKVDLESVIVMNDFGEVCQIDMDTVCPCGFFVGR